MPADNLPLAGNRDEAKAASHTPGPWKAIEGCSPIYNQLIGIAANEHSHIGVVAENHTALPSQWEANARLIAAAPDLLEALKAMMAESGAAEGNPDSDSPAERLARAAITKAGSEG